MFKTKLGKLIVEAVETSEKLNNYITVKEITSKNFSEDNFTELGDLILNNKDSFLKIMNSLNVDLVIDKNNTISKNSDEWLIHSISCINSFNISKLRELKLVNDVWVYIEDLERYDYIRNDINNLYAELNKSQSLKDFHLYFLSQLNSIDDIELNLNNYFSGNIDCISDESFLDIVNCFDSAIYKFFKGYKSNPETCIWKKISEIKSEKEEA